MCNPWHALKFPLLSSLLLSGLIYPLASPTWAADWPMVAANSGRTSWSPDPAPGVGQADGNLQLLWIKPIEPFVAITHQPIAANDGGIAKVFVSTSKGLYAFNADTGSQLWVYPTELPLGNSPTYANGKLYVGGLDRKLHVVNASNGQGLWTYTAGAGFETNPLVINGTVYLGNRDGYFYAIKSPLTGSVGQLLWRFDTGEGNSTQRGQILQSAAYSNTAGEKIFFGAMNGNAYALNLNGTLSWKTKLPVMGWNAMWPVIFQDKVLWTRTEFARNYSADNSGDATMSDELNYLFDNPDTASSNLPAGLVGAVNSGSQPKDQDWPSNPNVPDGMITADLTVNPLALDPSHTVINFIESHRHSRNLFVLNQTNGVENTFDLDGDGTLDGPPFLSTISDHNTSYPPMVSGHDGVIYLRNPIHARPNFSNSFATGWKYGTPIVSLVTNRVQAQWPMDEYTGLSGAGNYLYWNTIIGREGGSIDLAKPSTDANPDPSGRQKNFGVGALGDIPGYFSEATKFFWEPGKTKADSGLYYNHAYAPGYTIFNEKVFFIVANSLLAYSRNGASNPLVSTALNPNTSPVAATTLQITELQSRLETEISKIISAGHLKPGYSHTGNFELQQDVLGDNVLDYWSNPGDSIIILTSALPHLSEPLKTSLKNYIKTLYTNYPPYDYGHIGWIDGVHRQPFDWPSGLQNPTTPKQLGSEFYGRVPPQNVYAMYKYAEAGLDPGGASAVFARAQSENMLPATTNWTDQKLTTYPHALNAFIAGYVGYTKLAALAGQPASNYQTELNRLINLRKSNFVVVPDNSFITNPVANRYYHTLNTAWNFMYLVPELADELHTGIYTQVKQAIEINTDRATSPGPNANNGPRAPWWFVGENKEVQGENGIVPYHQTHALFQAKAKILGETQAELSKYIDSPNFQIGDLYYIDNLISTIEASDNPPPATPSPIPHPGDTDGDGDVDIFDYTNLLAQFGTNCASGCTADFEPDGDVDIFDYSVLLANFGF